MSVPEKIIELINDANTIGLVTHKDGDGDAFGSMLGLERILKSIGKSTNVFSTELLIPQFEFLKDKIDYHPFDTYKPVDLLIGTDANQFYRFTLPDIFMAAKDGGAKTAIIDHHLTSEIGKEVDLYWESQSTSCASEMIYDLSQQMGVKLDKITASVILMGIETDTMSMQFSNTRPKTYETVASLLKLGARLRPVVESAFGGKPIAVAKLLGRVIERLKTDQKGWGITFITLKDKSTLGLGSDPSSGVANFLDQVDALKVIAVFEERENNMVKVSLRSNNSKVNVNDVAGKFGGGGHEKAAGFEFQGKLADAIEQFEKENNIKHNA